MVQGGLKKKIYQLQSEFCHALSHPKRLEIMNILKEGEKSVSELLSITGYNKANLSQHLMILRKVRIVEIRKQGVTVFYRITNPKVLQACHTVQEVLFEQLMENEKMSQLMKENLVKTGNR